MFAPIICTDPILKVIVLFLFLTFRPSVPPLTPISLRSLVSTLSSAFACCAGSPDGTESEDEGERTEKYARIEREPCNDPAAESETHESATSRIDSFRFAAIYVQHRKLKSFGHRHQ